MGPGKRAWLLVAGGFGGLALVRAGSIEERDPYWQVRAGLDNLGGDPLIRADSWSWQSVPTDFVQTSPGWNSALGLVWEGAGFVGLFAIALLAIGSQLVVSVALSHRLGARPLPMLLGLGATCGLGLAFLSPRASLASQTLFMAAVLGADLWRDRRSAAGPSVVGVAFAALVVATFGSWIHLSWVLLGPALSMSVGALWLTSGNWSWPRRATLVLATTTGVTVGVFAGPYGIDALRLSNSVRQATEGLVVEWVGMLTPGLIWRWLPTGVFALLLVGYALVVLWRGRHDFLDERRVSLTLALLIPAAPAALAGFAGIRFIGVALLLMGPIASLAATAWADRVARRRAEHPPRGVMRSQRVHFWADGQRWPGVITGVLVVLSPLVLLMTLPLAKPMPEYLMVNRLPTNCRLLSNPGTAAPVILLRPDVTVWWDGRYDFYGRALNVRALQVLSGDQAQGPVLDESTCVLLDSDDQITTDRLARALDASPAWRPAGAEGSLRLWVRPA